MYYTIKHCILLLREDDSGIKMTISFEKTEEDRLTVTPAGTDNETPGKINCADLFFF